MLYPGRGRAGPDEIKMRPPKKGDAFLIFVLFPAAAQRMIVVISGRERVGREEFIHREFDVAEDFTGVIRSGICAFLIGNRKS